jgi:hypothetical protein
MRRWQVACCFVPTEGLWDELYDVLVDVGLMLCAIAEVLDDKAESGHRVAR